MTSKNGAYRCFASDCEEEFDSLDDMVWIDGKGGRDGRHFCRLCAHRVLNGYGRVE